MEIQSGHGAEPYLVSPTSAQAQAALRALKSAFGYEPVLMREGGSIPIVTISKKFSARTRCCSAWHCRTTMPIHRTRNSTSTVCERPVDERASLAGIERREFLSNHGRAFDQHGLVLFRYSSTVVLPLTELGILTALGLASFVMHQDFADESNAQIHVRHAPKLR